MLVARPESVPPPVFVIATDWGEGAGPPTTELNVIDVGEATIRGRSVTLIVTCPEIPPVLTVTVAVPGATPVTMPEPSTDATVVGVTDHWTVRAVNESPLSLFGVALNCWL